MAMTRWSRRAEFTVATPATSGITEKLKKIMRFGRGAAT